MSYSNKEKEIKEFYHFLSHTKEPTENVSKDQLIEGINTYDLGLDKKEKEKFIDRIGKISNNNKMVPYDKFKKLWEYDSQNKVDPSKAAGYCITILNQILIDKEKKENGNHIRNNADEFKLNVDELKILLEEFGMLDDCGGGEDKKRDLCKEMIESISNRMIVGREELTFLINKYLENIKKGDD